MKRALILATGEYEASAFHNLRSAAPDARRLASALGRPGYGDFEVATLIDPGLVAAQTGIHHLFSDSGTSDVAVLYLSGHGVKDASGRFYIALGGTQPSALPATALSGRFLREQMVDSSCQNVVVILDTCFAGAFGRDLLAKSLAVSSGVPTELTQSRGHAVIAAASAVQFAFETIAPQPESLFTRILCEGLEDGSADLDSDGWVGLQELFTYLADRLSEESSAQTPEINFFGLTGDLRLMRAPSRRALSGVDTDIQSALNSIHAELRRAGVDVLAKYIRSRNTDRRASARRELRRLRLDDDRDVRLGVEIALSTRTDRRRSGRVSFSQRVQGHEPSGVRWAQLPARTLREIADVLPRFAYLDAGIPVLELLRMSLSGGILSFITTDRYRLDSHEVHVDQSGKEDFRCLLPAIDFGALRRLPKRGSVRIELAGDRVEFSTVDKYLSMSAVTDVEYPKVDKIFDVSGSNATFAVSSALSAVENIANSIEAPRNRPVNLHAISERDGITVSMEGISARASFQYRGNLRQAHVAFNPRYLIEALSVMGDGDVCLTWMDSRRQVLLELDGAPEGQRHRHVLMPVRRQS